MLCAGVALPVRLLSQATGVPVRNAGVVQGISAGVDFGFGRIERPGGDDVSRAVAGRVSAGFGPLGASLLVSRTRIDPGVGPTTSYSAAAATAELTMIGGPLIPLKVMWQAGYAKALDAGSGGPWRGSLGLGAALTIPATVVSIRPWIAPRVDYLGRQVVQGPRLKPGLSAGVDLGLLNGLGVHVAYDNRLGWVDGRERAAGVSVGFRYHFR